MFHHCDVSSVLKSHEAFQMPDWNLVKAAVVGPSATQDR